MSADAREFATRRNKNTIHRLYAEVLSLGQLDLIDQFYAEDFVFTGREGTATREEVKDYIRMWREAFPDLTAVVDKIVAEGDEVAWSDLTSGTNSGAWNGQPPTGRRVEGVLTINEATFDPDGRLVAHRMVTDEIVERMQLGLLPETAILGTGR